MLIHRLLRRFWLLPSFLTLWIDGEGEGGADPGHGDGGAAPSADPAPVEPAAADVVPAEPSKPSSMLDAINKHFDAQDAQEAAGQARDAQGRFTKAETPAAPATGQPGAAPQGAQPPAKPAAAPAAVEPKPPAEDLLQMPEGLQPKAQQRFQQLVASNKEATARAEAAEAQVSYVRDTFQQHGIQRPQFEAMATYVGAVNRGDFTAARDLLLGQLRELSLAMGEPMPGVDALTEHTDLRAEVDAGRLTEAHALELARSRRGVALAQQNHQAQREQQQRQQQDQQATEAGLKEIDSFCKQMQATDLDFEHIEAQLLPEIQNLIGGLPPQRWKQAIETQYRLLKKVAGSARGAAPATTGTVLRATGASSPAARPRTLHEAMWGTPQPGA